MHASHQTHLALTVSTLLSLSSPPLALVARFVALRRPWLLLQRPLLFLLRLFLLLLKSSISLSAAFQPSTHPPTLVSSSTQQFLSSGLALVTFRLRHRRNRLSPPPRNRANRSPPSLLVPCVFSPRYLFYSSFAWRPIRTFLTIVLTPSYNPPPRLKSPPSLAYSPALKPPSTNPLNW